MLESEPVPRSKIDSHRRGSVSVPPSIDPYICTPRIEEPQMFGDHNPRWTKTEALWT